MVDGVSILPLRGSSRGLAWPSQPASDAPQRALPIGGATTSADALARVEGLTAQAPAANDSFPREGFVCGPENALVQAVLACFARSAQATAEPTEAPAETASPPFNPLVLVGPSGVGKTHVGEALAAEAAVSDPTPGAVRYELAGDFVDAFLAAHRRHDELADDTAVLTVPTRLWVFDGLDYLAGKPATQAALARMLDELLTHGGLFVGTARVSPAALADYSPALKARLQGGLVLPIVRPEFAARQALVRLFAARRERLLTDDVVQTLATGLVATARELAGAVVQLDEAARLDGREITREDAQRLVQVARRPTPELSRIASAVAKACGIKTNQLRSSSRQQSVVAARGLAMWLAREWTPLSLAEIGQYFGGRDHGTVLHACRKIAEQLETDTALTQTVHDVRQRLGAPAHA